MGEGAETAPFFIPPQAVLGEGDHAQHSRGAVFPTGRCHPSVSPTGCHLPLQGRNGVDVREGRADIAPNMPDILNAYRRLIDAQELRPDPEQAAAAARLEQLATELETPRKTGLFARLTGKGAPAPKGVYLWGDVGRGKSMLMDLFFDHVAVEPKRRVHFAEFMLEVHARIATERAKQAGGTTLKVHNRARPCPVMWLSPW